MSSAAAFVKTDDKYCAAKIEKTSAGIKLISAQYCKSDDLDSLLAEPVMSNTPTVLGVDPSGIAFYNIEVPSVDDAQMTPIVRMQAETVLPLPLDQMQIAYRKGRPIAEKSRITIAAARTSKLSQYVPFAKTHAIENIVLSADGIARAFNELFDIPENDFVALNIRTRDTQVLLCQDGNLVKAASLDIGIEQLSDPENPSDEIFVYDLRNALDMFGLDMTDQPAVYIHSQSRRLAESVTIGLNDAGIQTTLAELKPSAIDYAQDQTLNKAYRCLEAIGSALLILDEENKPLDLFAGLLSEDKNKKQKNFVANPLLKSAVLFVLMLILAVFTLDYLNKLELAKYNNEDVEKLVKDQKIRKLIATQRPDILELMTVIHKDTPGGIIINGISFKKGEKVTITAQASNQQQMVALQEFLSNKKEFTDVTRQNPSFDAKKKKYNFKINFHYKNWTRKSIR